MGNLSYEDLKYWRPHSWGGNMTEQRPDLWPCAWPNKARTRWKTQSETWLRTTFAVSASPQSYDLVLLYFTIIEIVKKIKENVVKWAKQVALILSLALQFCFWDGLWQVFLSFFFPQIVNLQSLFFFFFCLKAQWGSDSLCKMLVQFLVWWLTA